jgi:predicted permease
VRKGLIILLLKITVLPALQFICARVCGLATDYSMALLLLSICPCASAAFVVSSNYNQ